ncbi:zinc ABC transporter substrate-binding protein [Lactobacillaceae bacterium L1_55_11]|nr:zinc ABC transporter substrate-binding protein [Lactobacillaceae bacterium L1_55_11]
MKRTIWLINILALIVIGTVGWAVFKPQNQPSQSDKIKIVTSTSVYAQVAKAVAGDHADVSAVITKQNVSPEDYEPTSAVAHEVSQAQVVVANGLGYDAWLNKLAKANTKVQLVQVGSDVLGLKDGANPHLWNDPENMAKTAHYLADVLSKKDPKHRSDYQKNADSYVQSLKPVTNLVAELKPKTSGLKVTETEPVFEYMLNALGVQITNEDFAEAVEEGNDPSPAVLASLRSDIENHQMAFLVDNTQTTSSTVTNIVDLAKKNNIPIVKVTETSPENQSYVDWKLSELKQIQAILHQ